jgi:hypothetical protein
MKTLLFALLLSATFVVAQDAKPATAQDSKQDKDWITVQGCVNRTNGDYILMKQEPGFSYELQESHKIRLHNYLGQRVEVSGEQSPTLGSSSDALNKVGSASAVTITVRSIKTIDKECPLH